MFFIRSNQIGNVSVPRLHHIKLARPYRFFVEISIFRKPLGMAPGRPPARLTTTVETQQVSSNSHRAQEILWNPQDFNGCRLDPGYEKVQNPLKTRGSSLRDKDIKSKYQIKYHIKSLFFGGPDLSNQKIDLSRIFAWLCIDYIKSYRWAAIFKGPYKS